MTTHTATSTATPTPASTPTGNTALVVTAADKLKRTLGKSSLDDFMQTARRSMMLVDVSTSMGDYIRSGGTKILATRTVVATLRESNPVPVAVFGREIEIVDRVPEPCGGTPMHLGIDFCKQQGADHLVLITDGEPDSESYALESARAFGGVIDVFYIGDGTDRGSQFAKELAALTGGTVNLTDLGAPKQLAAKIAGLLGSGE